ncbi:hypothetical protein FF011L_12990 [Roseimaritima multifibrata]|uniref:Uncharacterized protein n=1 Tax=Roseimaritima multifibrata TaxID=1930274 RepID=A0A517MCD7_9BACT|nr:hypothetical protein [Roseimaritima multifibrata]QDS92552.1 hypothetical protein FF011L_12990 [Roseimaritima multifibrata]
MWFEPFAIVLALLPLAAYLLLLGTIRLFFPPLVTSGGRDLVALAMALAGMLAVGPVELFFPGAAAALFGPAVWLAMILFYALLVLLIVVTIQPRLIVYGASAPEVVEPLFKAALRLDAKAQQDSRQRQVWLPTLGIRLRIDGHRHFDTSQVVAFERDLTPQFWAELLGGLRFEMKSAPTVQRYGGAGMLFVGMLLLLLVASVAYTHPTEVSAGFKNWLWRQ